jgi:hypothetical protein
MLLPTAIKLQKAIAHLTYLIKTHASRLAKFNATMKVLALEAQIESSQTTESPKQPETQTTEMTVARFLKKYPLVKGSDKQKTWGETIRQSVLETIYSTDKKEWTFVEKNVTYGHDNFCDATAWIAFAQENKKWQSLRINRLMYLLTDQYFMFD